MQQQADEEELGLSSAALAALKEFALENNILGESCPSFHTPTRVYSTGGPLVQRTRC